VLTGEGLDGATGEVEVTVGFGDRTFTASATRKVPGTAFPAEYRLHDFREIEPEPEPEPEVVEDVAGRPSAPASTWPSTVAPS
jgi:hypothetical protein